jgi:hypothetical protein
MTAAQTTPAALQAHARDLAKAFNARLIESDQLKPDEALGLGHLRVALVATIVDESTYAVALHELGHLASPTGIVRHVVQGERMNILRIEEAAAWAWARHYALIWTPLMEQVATWAEGTYQQDAPARPEPQAPAAPPKNIDWSNWK